MSTTDKPVHAKRQVPAKGGRGSVAAASGLRKQVRAVAKEVKVMGKMAAGTAQAKLEQVRDDASDYYEQGREQARDVQRTVEQFIRETPVKSLLIAAGVGLLIGRFWMRR